MTTVSVIVPVYNAQKYVKRAIRSVIEQPAFDKMELILVNDGSTDESAEICNQFADEYENVIAIHKKNAGVGEARNDGIAKAKGKYIAFLDADDWFDKGVFTEELIEEFESSNTCIYGFSYKVVSFNFKYYTIVNKVKEETKCGEKNGEIPFIWRPFWSFIYKAALIKENNLKLFPVKYNEDMSFTQRCFYLAKEVKFNPNNLYVQWSNLSSAMHTKKELVFFGEHYKSLFMLKEWYEERGGVYFPEYPIMAIIAQVLPVLCATYKYKEVVELLTTDERFKILNEYEKYPIAKDDMDEIKAYLANPKKYWRKKRIFLRAKISATNFLNKHKGIRAFINGIYYTFIRKREKLDKKQINEIKKQAM